MVVSTARRGAAMAGCARSAQPVSLCENTPRHCTRLDSASIRLLGELMATIIYGIPNCDSVKKARKWLDSHGIGHEFVDFRQTPVERSRLDSWLGIIGPESLVNRRSTTWKSLSDDDRARVSSGDGAALIAENITLIKRPVLEHGTVITVGFSDAAYTELFKSVT